MAAAQASSTAGTIVVIGAGLAGMTAALSAAEAAPHATVIVYDKEERLGGNSAKATSGMNASGTPPQDASSVHDTFEVFVDDTMQSGHGECDEAMVARLASDSASAWEFIRGHGVSLDVISQCGGHTKARTHRCAPSADGKPAPPVGWAVTSALRKTLEGTASVKLCPGHAVKQLQVSSATTGAHGGAVAGRVTGVLVQGASGPAFAQPADAVILATGGYAFGEDTGSLLREVAPPGVADLPTTNGCWATGDGVRLGTAVGAGTRDMAAVQVHPTGLVSGADLGARQVILGPEALRASGAILLSPATCQRFANELARRDDLSTAMYAACGIGGDGSPLAPVPGVGGGITAGCHGSLPARPARAVMVLTQEAVDAFGPNFGFYWKAKGLFTRVEGVEGLAESLATAGVAAATPEVLGAELKVYADAAGAGGDSFGKTLFPAGETFRPAADGAVVLYWGWACPAVHYTMGGLLVDAGAGVLTLDHPSPLYDPSDGEGTPAWTPSAPTAAVVAVHGVSEAGTPAPTPAPHIEVTPGALPRPIPGLFAAGEVTGGVHGLNRLAGNSLLECVVFGRVAGSRAGRMVVARDAPALAPDTWTPLTLREKSLVAPSQWLFRFDLPSPSHTLAKDSGHREGGATGKYIKVRAELEGEEVVRCYSPASRLGAQGCVDLLLKIDPPKAGGRAAMTSHFASLPLGATLDFSGLHGDLGLDFRVLPGLDGLGGKRALGLVAGGTGISPMLGIIRSVLHHNRQDLSVTLAYGSNAPDSFAYLPQLQAAAEAFPPLTIATTADSNGGDEGYTGRVGYMDGAFLSSVLPPPGPDTLIVLCGPWKMCQVLKGVLGELGYSGDQLYSYM